MTTAAAAADRVARDCLAWLDERGYGAALVEHDRSAGGLATVIAQVERRTLFIICRTEQRTHITRCQLRRQAAFMRHGARPLTVHSRRELELALELLTAA